MDSERFRPLTASNGPFVSVYFDDSRDTSVAEAHLGATWRDLRTHLEDAGADEDIVLRLQRAVLEGEPVVGRQGRGVVVTHDEVLIDEHLTSSPPKAIVRVSDYPYIMPLVELGRQRPTYVFAAVDHLGAQITVHRSDTSRSETVDGGGYPVHKPVTAGWNGYGDVERSAEEAVRMNVRAVADRLTELGDATGAEVVFVCGEVRSRSDVVSALPDRVMQRVSKLPASARGHRAREPEISDMVDRVFERRRKADIAEIADRYTSEKGRGSGLAAEGLSAVCAALREGCVDTLIVGALGDATVVTGENRCTVAPNADVLSELGEAPDRVVRADEALPFAAVAVGASLISIGDCLAPADGVAALLRYAPTDVVNSSASLIEPVVL
jgi:hypothetical protein